ELRQDKVASQFLAGIEATAREIDSVFARHGISRIKAIGEQLDPHRHQAMMEVPSDTAEPGTIVEEMQPGYMLRRRLPQRPVARWCRGRCWTCWLLSRAPRGGGGGGVVQKGTP